MPSIRKQKGDGFSLLLTIWSHFMTTTLPEFCDLAIFVLTTDKLITLPLAHARGVIKFLKSPACHYTASTQSFSLHGGWLINSGLAIFKSVHWSSLYAESLTFQALCLFYHCQLNFDVGWESIDVVTNHAHSLCFNMPAWGEPYIQIPGCDLTDRLWPNESWQPIP